MPALSSFEYAVLRVVPRVEREEFVNAGVVLFCLERRFLAAQLRVDESRWRTLWPGVDIASVRDHLEAFTRICGGHAESGPIALLSQRERFRWLVGPRSTSVQVSPVHAGLCIDPAAELDRLTERLAG